jgi:hypothetical protein
VIETLPACTTTRYSAALHCLLSYRYFYSPTFGIYVLKNKKQTPSYYCGMVHVATGNMTMMTPTPPCLLPSSRSIRRSALLACLIPCLLFLVLASDEGGSCAAKQDGESPEGCNAEPAMEGIIAAPPRENRGTEEAPRKLVSWGDTDCVDQDERDCEMRAFRGDCAKNPSVVLKKCPSSCALCNNHKGNKVRTCYGDPQTANEAETLEVIKQMQEYMIHSVYVDDAKYRSVRAECKNRNKDCAYWASLGDCEKNPKFMKV